MIKVLIVDDSPVATALLKHILNSDPQIEVIGTASNGEEAIVFTETEKPDLITMDIIMPRMDGWTIFKIIRQDHSFDNVPIAILTAKSQQVDQMVGLHIMNADAYITKPFGKQELIDKTYELIGKRKQPSDTGG